MNVERILFKRKNLYFKDFLEGFHHFNIEHEVKFFGPLRIKLDKGK